MVLQEIFHDSVEVIDMQNDERNLMGNVKNTRAVR